MPCKHADRYVIRQSANVITSVLTIHNRSKANIYKQKYGQLSINLPLRQNYSKLPSNLVKKTYVIVMLEKQDGVQLQYLCSLYCHELTSPGVFHVLSRAPVLMSRVKPWVAGLSFPIRGPFTANITPPAGTQGTHGGVTTKGGHRSITRFLQIT